MLAKDYGIIVKCGEEDQQWTGLVLKENLQTLKKSSQYQKQGKIFKSIILDIDTEKRIVDLTPMGKDDE
jgi:hypothetical protein